MNTIATPILHCAQLGMQMPDKMKIANGTFFSHALFSMYVMCIQALWTDYLLNIAGCGQCLKFNENLIRSLWTLCLCILLTF